MRYFLDHPVYNCLSHVSYSACQRSPCLKLQITYPSLTTGNRQTRWIRYYFHLHLSQFLLITSVDIRKQSKYIYQKLPNKLQVIIIFWINTQALTFEWKENCPFSYVVKLIHACYVNIIHVMYHIARNGVKNKLLVKRVKRKKDNKTQNLRFLPVVFLKKTQSTNIITHAKLDKDSALLRHFISK